MVVPSSSSPSLGDMLGLCGPAHDKADYWKRRFEASQNEIWRLRTAPPAECSTESLWLPMLFLTIGLIVAVRVVTRRDRAGRKALLKKVDATLKKRLSETPRPPATRLDTSPSVASLLSTTTMTCPSISDRGDLSPKDSVTIAKQEEFLRGLFGDYEKLTPTKARSGSGTSCTERSCTVNSSASEDSNDD